MPDACLISNKTPATINTMTVKQLIEELQKLDPDKMVVTSGYEGGFNEIISIGEIRLKLNVNANTWYYGDHEEAEEDEEADCHAVQIG